MEDSDELDNDLESRDPGDTPRTEPGETLRSHHHGKRVLACRECSKRKTKCAKVFPCPTCVKAGVDCVESTPAPPRKRRNMLGELAREVAALRAELKEVQQNSGGEPGTMVTDDWFTNSKAYAGVHKFLQSFPDSLLDDRSSDDEDEETESASLDDLFLGEDLSPAPEPRRLDYMKLWPTQQQTGELWKLFRLRVDPLFKLIHVPTLLPYIGLGSTRPEKLDLNVITLLFSIWLMAVVSMTPEECLNLMGCSQSAALDRFTRAVCICLKRYNFPAKFDFTVLQAYFLFLSSLQGRRDKHSIWLRTGTALRIAQRMGLHQDGEQLGLKPFATEMRRRLWWQIVMVDTKYALMNGLNASVLPPNRNTKEPTNIDDADMDPEARDYFRDRDGPTELIFCQILVQVTKFLVSTPDIEAVVLCAEMDGLPNQDAQEKAILKGKLATLNQGLLDLLSKRCDVSRGGVHKLADLIRDQVIQKMQELAQESHQPSELGVESHAFKLAVCALEQDQRNCASSNETGFLWFAKAQFQYECVAFIAGELCKRTQGELVMKAWNLLEQVYRWHPELFEIASNKRYKLLAVLVLRAWNERELALVQAGQPTTPMAPFLEALKAKLAEEEAKPAQACNSESPADDSMGGMENHLQSPGGDMAIPSFHIQPPPLGFPLAMQPYYSGQQNGEINGLNGQNAAFPSAQHTWGTNGLYHGLENQRLVAHAGGQHGMADQQHGIDGQQGHNYYAMNGLNGLNGLAALDRSGGSPHIPPPGSGLNDAVMNGHLHEMPSTTSLPDPSVPSYGLGLDGFDPAGLDMYGVQQDVNFNFEVYSGANGGSS